MGFTLCFNNKFPALLRLIGLYLSNAIVSMFISFEELFFLQEVINLFPGILTTVSDGLG